MEERNTVKFKKEEFAVKEYIKSSLGKGKVSQVKIVYTPIGEKIVISTTKPGLVIGRRGENIDKLTETLKTEFKMGNPKIDIDEIMIPEFDSQIIADEIALQLERFGPIKFKVIAYRTLQKIMKAGAMGVEIRLNGKLPSKRAKSWRFAQGYLKKTGEPSKMVYRAQATAQTKPGTVGVKVAILAPGVKLIDRIDVDEKLIKSLEENSETLNEEPKIEKIKKVKKKK